MTGKEKCNILKAIRIKIASLNGIEYKPNECPHEGPCPGTCPACEAEAEELMMKLFEKEANGTSINVDTNILAELDSLACTWKSDPAEEDEITEIAELGVIMTPGFIEGKQGEANGKLRGTIMIPADISKDDALNTVKNDEKIKPFIEGHCQEIHFL